MCDPEACREQPTCGLRGERGVERPEGRPRLLPPSEVEQEGHAPHRRIGPEGRVRAEPLEHRQRPLGLPLLDAQQGVDERELVGGTEVGDRAVEAEAPRRDTPEPQLGIEQQTYVEGYVRGELDEAHRMRPRLHEAPSEQEQPHEVAARFDQLRLDPERRDVGSLGSWGITAGRAYVAEA